jgi:flagellar protein FliS
MSAHLAPSPAAYRESAVLTATPEQLVVMLYDGARRFLAQAAAAMRAGNVQQTHDRLRRAEDIVLHLEATLDLSQGELPERLKPNYGFCRRHLLAARIDRDASKLDEVSALLGELREAWAQVGGA